MPTVRTCCCGCSLKTGTLILVILSLFSVFDLIGSLIEPKTAPKGAIGLELIFVITAIPALYGTLKEQPAWLIPYMVAHVVFIVLVLIAMVIMLFIGPVMLSVVSSMGSKMHDEDEAKAGIIFFTVIVEVVLGICAALSYYFFVVIYSFYKQLKSKAGGIPA